MLTEIEASYLSGIIDGEGCISLFSSKNCYLCRVQVTSTNRKLIDWITERVSGGTISEKPVRQEWEEQFEWRLHNKEGLRWLLPQVIPFLIIKKLHAQLLLKYCTDFPHSTNRHVSAEDKEIKAAYLVLFRSLNRTGVGSTAEKESVVNLFASGEVKLPE